MASRMAEPGPDLARLSRELATTPARPSDLPPVLYHYTSPQGLLGIVESNRVWATNLKYMNDFSEIEYAEQLFRNAFERKKEATPSGRARGFLDLAESHCTPLTHTLDAFAFCLCENGDQLSQWREYAARGTGYAIGFDTAGLAFPEDALLTPVTYDPDEQQRSVSDLLDRVTERYEQAAADHDVKEPSLDDPTTATFLDALATRLAVLAVSSKNPVFVEENEWRVVFASPAKNWIHRLKFRASNVAIIPYVELDLLEGSPQHGKLPLRAVVQGPQVAPEIGERALHLLLARYGYDDVGVVRSQVPLRSLPE